MNSGSTWFPELFYISALVRGLLQKQEAFSNLLVLGYVSINFYITLN